MTEKSLQLLRQAALSMALLLTAASRFGRSGGLLGAQEHHACGVVIGLDPSTAPYQTCIVSLERSLSELAQAQDVQRSRLSCAQEGLAPGTSGFAACVVGAGLAPMEKRYAASAPIR
jgi:hypothetical protein